MRWPLVAPQELAELLASATAAPTLLDIRWDVATGADYGAYRDGHIPGAVFVDLDSQLSAPASERGRHPLPDASRFGADMRAAGVSAVRPVVVYDAATSVAAARAWWLLRYFGHPDVAVLDGGVGAWVQAGYPLSTHTASVTAGDFLAQAGGMRIVEPEQVEEVVADGVLIDARAHERFLGITEPIDPVAGHIPGARNRPTTENVEPDGRFRSPDELNRAFEALGVRAATAVAAYCGSGVTAAHEVLALELAGYAAALYPGSWSEWIKDPARPVARGEA